MAAELDNDDARLVFTWLFTVLIVGQGVIIFWFHLYQDREARKKLNLGRFFSNFGHFFSKKQAAVFQRGRNGQEWFKQTPSGATPADSSLPSLTLGDRRSAGTLPPAYKHAPMFEPPSFTSSGANALRRTSSLPTVQTNISSASRPSDGSNDARARRASALARLPLSPEVGGISDSCSSSPQVGGFAMRRGLLAVGDDAGEYSGAGEYITAYPVSVAPMRGASVGGSDRGCEIRKTVWRQSVASTTLAQMPGPAHFDEGAMFYGLDSIGAGSMRGVSVSGESWTPASGLAAPGLQHPPDSSDETVTGLIAPVETPEPDSIRMRPLSRSSSASIGSTCVAEGDEGRGAPTIMPAPSLSATLPVTPPSTAAVDNRRGSAVLQGSRRSSSTLTSPFSRALAVTSSLRSIDSTTWPVASPSATAVDSRRGSAVLQGTKTKLSAGSPEDSAVGSRRSSAALQGSRRSSLV